MQWAWSTPPESQSVKSTLFELTWLLLSGARAGHAQSRDQHRNAHTHTHAQTTSNTFDASQSTAIPPRSAAWATQPNNLSESSPNQHLVAFIVILVNHPPLRNIDIVAPFRDTGSLLQSTSASPGQAGLRT
ncbi:uncharacterized protein PAN0_074c6608 [Moesziomyces antarcticus]|uniref:Uncharacterized protein n=2 Tax=Pseudozyma antarctica TaxID=84753 RepID=A0A5C3FVG0_PSEA2|nr:uncharacterized protein PAN0_074c6608 [Moesziomyces antarcticus]GAK68362.1 hypothetical protein PAN0_074c6608 [Moesziomyces antarcticus]SPO47319.1 uncharacterized protein PSANT_05007 [Moesziomyces antarcticus]